MDRALTTSRRPHFRGAVAVWRGRAWRWCVRRTERDARLAASRLRPISPQNLRRMIARRWNDVNRQVSFRR